MLHGMVSVNDLGGRFIMETCQVNMEVSDAVTNYF